MAATTLKIRLEVVTPSKRILQKEVDEVYLPGALGEFGILPMHTPFLTVLGVGAMRIVENGVSTKYMINGGFAEASSNQVIVLTEGCEPAAEIDLDRAKRTKAESEKRLLELDAGDAEYQEIWDRLKRANARIQVGESADL